uniref:Uncharacterized protein n=1 Tax=Arundo donax TaxID=35708 RepID=A0A0A9A547_ARUDO
MPSLWCLLMRWRGGEGRGG